MVPCRSHNTVISRDCQQHQQCQITHSAEMRCSCTRLAQSRNNGCLNTFDCISSCPDNNIYLFVSPTQWVQHQSISLDAALAQQLQPRHDGIHLRTTAEMTHLGWSRSLTPPPVTRLQLVNNASQAGRNTTNQADKTLLVRLTETLPVRLSIRLT
jgi:hypothetical protein